MTDCVKCPEPGCCLHYDPARFGPHPLHVRLERDSAYLDDLKARAARGEPLKHEPWTAGEKEREEAASV
jgi:hypothetical protein